MQWTRPGDNPNWFGTGRTGGGGGDGGGMPMPGGDGGYGGYGNADPYGGGPGGMGPPPIPPRGDSGALNAGTRGFNDGAMGFPGGPQGGGYGGYGGGYQAPPGPPPVPNRGYPPPPGPPSGYPGQDYGRGSPGSHMYNTPPQSSYSPYPQGGHPGRSGSDFEYVKPGQPHMPPSQMQYYGPDMTTPGGGHQQHNFVYSQCNGKKKALIIGINYVGTDQALGGCINDANRIKAFIIEMFHYKDGDIVVLTDDARNPQNKPTRANIEAAMGWLVRGASANDSLFFHYSGHGGLTKDLDGDEEDGNDEVIYPMDHKVAGHIVDDEMHRIMVQPLPAGCRLTAIFDSCHSGSALDLPYIYSTEGKVKEPNLLLDAGSSLLSIGKGYMTKDYGAMFKAAKGLVGAATGKGNKADELTRRTRTSPADVISWSGCKDSQTSADTEVNGQGTGAMSWAFMESLRQNPQQSYQQLLVSIRRLLRDKYSQKPQLSSSHPMDTDIIFVA